MPLRTSQTPLTPVFSRGWKDQGAPELGGDGVNPCATIPQDCRPWECPSAGSQVVLGSKSRADGAAMGMSERRGSVFWKAPESRIGITHSQWGLDVPGRALGEALTAPVGWV